ncbi:MAG: cytochrome-c peroxidase [bacterium]
MMAGWFRAFGYVSALCFSLIAQSCQDAAAPVAGPYLLEMPLGLDANARNIPADNPLTAAKVELGRQLFFDQRLSADGTVACATCHNPLLGFTDGKSVATGIEQQEGVRNTPTLINRLFGRSQFWDGRAGSLEEQVLGPLENPREMASTLENVVRTVAADPSYQSGFHQVFDSEITMTTIVRAIAAFERTLVSGNSLYDQFKAGNTGALSESARRGLTLFESERTNCTACHSGHNLTNEAFRNNGAGMDIAAPDSGRFKITGRQADFGAFKVPTLRDVARTAPYMHDGSLSTLAEVVEFYDRGGIPNKYQSKEIQKLNLTGQEKRDLTAFLQSLNGRNTWQSL